MTQRPDRDEISAPRADNLMVVPEPADKAFVERVRHELEEARRRSREISDVALPE